MSHTAEGHPQVTDSTKRLIQKIYAREDKVFFFDKENGSIVGADHSVVCLLMELSQLMKEEVRSNPNLVEVNGNRVMTLTTRLRDLETDTPEFRDTLDALSEILLNRAADFVPMVERTVETPTGYSVEGQVLDDENVVIVPILRAGTGMESAALRVFRRARVGKVGFARDEETLQPKQYLWKVPPLEGKTVVIIDPMNATGGSCSTVIEKVMVGNPAKVIFVSAMSAPEGVNEILTRHPEVTLVTTPLEDFLNEHGYIIPGLGDAGDRLHHT